MLNSLHSFGVHTQGTASCVITLGVNGSTPAEHPESFYQDYSPGIERIRQGLERTAFNGDFLAWDQAYPDGSPTHAESPFAFKPFCFVEAQSRGYQLVLWLDAGVDIKKPVGPLMEIIRSRGYLLLRETHSLGEYCKDEALTSLGITREQSFTIPSCRSSVLGLNLKSLLARDFLRQWKELSEDGVTFRGPKWSGRFGYPRTASDHPQVKGHRHDQTAASAVAHRLGMHHFEPLDFFDRFFRLDRGFVRRYSNESPDRKLVDRLRTGARMARRILKKVV